jgi:hypothetical protein
MHARDPHGRTRAGSSARLAAKAADKAARGWAGEGLDGDGLPEADMVAFEFANFQVCVCVCSGS